MSDAPGGKSRNRRVIEEAVEAFNRGDVDAVIANVAQDATWEPFLSATETPLLRGREEIRAAWRRQLDVIDLNVEFEILAEEGDRLAGVMTLAARGQGSGMSVDAELAQLYVFEDGLVREVSNHPDIDAALAAMRSRGSDP